MKKSFCFLCFILAAAVFAAPAVLPPAFADVQPDRVMLTDTRNGCVLKSADGFFDNSPEADSYSVYRRLPAAGANFTLDFKFGAADITGLASAGDLYTGSLALTFWVWIDDADFSASGITDSQIELSAAGVNDDAHELHWET
ncbi:MAG: hypothetical protein LBL66_09845, partial [Clostridiales bacterium]|nr:hypothetical protein [Clostridiales bacterium]